MFKDAPQQFGNLGLLGSVEPMPLIFGMRPCFGELPTKSRNTLFRCSYIAAMHRNAQHGEGSNEDG